jgi:2-polyprenyl-6-methoxyphenol hydroxylase-like FAD-dependent oxidoreductase
MALHGTLAGSNMPPETTGARSHAERRPVVVIGAGIGGLATALALKRSGREVVIVERDADSDVAPEAAFADWERPGVPQLRHTHIFLSRIRTILRDHHPELLAELRHAGVEESKLEQVLPPGVRTRYQTTPKDDDLLHLWARRATLERVIRAHVARLGQVRFVHGARVEGLLVERRGGALEVLGIEVRRAGETEQILAELVVDASGSRSKVVDWLNDRGAGIEAEAHHSPCAYFCRHYVQRDPSTEPPRVGTGGILDYLVFGIFFAERGSFSIALTCSDAETELSRALHRPEGFDRICQAVPALAQWTSRAEPASKVLGGAGLRNRWHRHSRTRARQVVGFFPVGDSYVQTNPIYGRGCSSAFVQAHVLADVLAADTDPVERARRYHAEVWRLLRPYFALCVNGDRVFGIRARLSRGDAVTFAERLLVLAYEKVLVPALDESTFVARLSVEAQQMRETGPFWLTFLVWVHVGLLWIARAFRRTSPVSVTAPSRAEMLGLIGPSAGTSEPSEPDTVAGAV